MIGRMDLPPQPTSKRVAYLNCVIERIWAGFYHASATAATNLPHAGDFAGSHPLV